MPHPCLCAPSASAPSWKAHPLLHALCLPMCPIPTWAPHPSPNTTSSLARRLCLRTPSLSTRFTPAVRSVPLECPVSLRPVPACAPRILRGARCVRAPGKPRGRRRRRAGADWRRRLLPASLPPPGSRGPRPRAPPCPAGPGGAAHPAPLAEARRGGRDAGAERRSGRAPVHHSGASREEDDGGGGGATPGYRCPPARPRPGAPRRRAGKGVRGLAHLPGGQRRVGAPLLWGGGGNFARRGDALRTCGPRDAPDPGAGGELPRPAEGLLLSPQVGAAAPAARVPHGRLARGAAGSRVFWADVSGSLRWAGFTALWKEGWEGRYYKSYDTAKFCRMPGWGSHAPSREGNTLQVAEQLWESPACVSLMNISFWKQRAELGRVTAFPLGVIYIL